MNYRYQIAVTKVFSLAIIFLLLAGSLAPLQGVGQAAPVAQDAGTTSQHTGIYRGYSTAVKFDISPALRDLAQVAVTLPSDFQDLDPDSGLEGALGPQDIDPSVQAEVGQGEIPDPLVSFDGFTNVAGYTPPDPVGDVGPNHYVAMANVHFAVYDKSGTLLYGPFANNTLWSGFGGACEVENSGDPIVIYDQLADRWMLTQFTSAGPTYYNCVALSTSGDPTGTYYRYAFSTGVNFPDYPKYGVWSDAYYISTREFGPSGNFVGVGAYALNRDEMLAGDTSPGVVSFMASPSPLYNVGDGLLPSDLDGTTLPPAGSPNFFMGSMDDGAGYGAPQDALTLWKFHVDWVTPANSYFNLTNTIPTDPFDSMFPCSPGSRDCIPQPGTSEKIDILSYRQRPIWRLAYRNFGTHEAMVTNQSVEASANMAGNRWYEIRDPNGMPLIYQQGTYAPGVSDGIHRWMASIAMDRDGNMAMGYSASNGTTTYPSVWYTGRLASDPLGTMAQGEGVIVNGLGSQTSTGSRWGDYTSMNIDPVDDCTFWYINEYYPTTSSTGWRLRIGAFKFPSCGTGEALADLEVEKTGEPAVVLPGGSITFTITATNNGPDTTLPITDTMDFANSTGIIIPLLGAATPYPSMIGVPSLGPLVDVNVDLVNFSHSYPEDVNVLLVGPDGQNVLLMSDVGGGVDSTNLNFTFDDSAAGYLPDGEVALASGIYLPTDYVDQFGDDAFPAPAPADPYGSLLSSFNSTDPAGDWNLYVYDDSNSDEGSVAGGWSLELSYQVPGVTLTDTLPAGFIFQGASIPAGWSCEVVGQLVICSSPTMPVGQYPFEIYGDAPATTGYITNTVEITGSAFDPFTTNNTAAFPVLVDTAPVAGDDAYNTDEDVALTVPTPGVLGNDSDADGDTLAAYLNTGPSNGSVALSLDGSFEYTPDPDFYGTDSFTYLVDDGFLSSEATVLIDVAALNDAPIAMDDVYETLEDTPLVVAAPGLLVNDSDVDGDMLMPSLVTPPANGELVLTDDGSFVYTPTLNFNGMDYFTYSISDGEFADEAGVTITVSPVNDDPFADAGEDQTAAEGQEVLLQGTVGDPGRKFNPQGIVDIAWDLGDGTLVTGTLTVTHTYADNSLFTVTLTATDDLGAVAVDTLLVTVENIVPELDEVADQALTLGEVLMLTVGYSDPGVLDTQTVMVDWGDGLTEMLELAAGGSDFGLSHTFQTAGNFTVVVTITDKDGGTSDQTFVVTVESGALFMFIPAVYK